MSFLQKVSDLATRIGQELKNIKNESLPIGSILPFAGATIVGDFLLCDGSEISRSTYADLYNVIGDTYGSGDGTTTFNVPNLTNRFIQGSTTAGTVEAAGLPNITGSFVLGVPVTNTDSPRCASMIARGCFYADSTKDIVGRLTMAQNSSTAFDKSATTNFSAQNSSSIYGKSTTVQPPALTMQYVIKYA